MSNATYTAPLGIPDLDLGILATFAIFTASGAISNTNVSGNTGDVTTGSGAISGFDTIRGTAFSPTATNSQVIFALYYNNTVVPNSQRTMNTLMYTRNEEVALEGAVNVTNAGDISIKAKVVLGTAVFSNRVLWARSF
jgi:hypothetical protein